jgi:hypothetical protein
LRDGAGRTWLQPHSMRELADIVSDAGQRDLRLLAGEQRVLPAVRPVTHKLDICMVLPVYVAIVK